jgi:hypothetical protein
MDCIIGKKHYHDIMKDFTGYLHHVIYIILSFSILDKNLTGIFLLYMIAELPTFIMNCGKFNPDFRNDKAFGLSFFITRILFLVYLTVKFKSLDNLILYSGMAAVGIHSYWFYKWYEKYY